MTCFFVINLSGEDNIIWYMYIVMLDIQQRHGCVLQYIDMLYVQLRQLLYTHGKNRIYVSCVHVVDILQQFVSNFPFSSFFHSHFIFSSRAEKNISAQYTKKNSYRVPLQKGYNVKILKIYQGFSIWRKVLFGRSVKSEKSFVIVKIEKRFGMFNFFEYKIVW